MDALAAARNAATDAAASGDSARLAEVQAYATLALAEAVNRLATAPAAKALHTAAARLRVDLAHTETVRVGTVTQILHSYANEQDTP